MARGSTPLSTVDHATTAPATEPAADRPRPTHIDPAGERRALAQLDGGDRRAALSTLLDLYGAAIFSYCARVLRDEVLAQDVQQVVFLEVHRDLPKFRRESSLWTWISRIAHNRCMDAAARRRRERQRSVPLDGDDDVALPVSTNPSPDATSERARWRAALERCLDRLSEPVRATVLMKYHQGLTFDEMAEVVGDRSGTLQVRVSRALPILRQCLERAGVSL